MRLSAVSLPRAATFAAALGLAVSSAALVVTAHPGTAGAAPHRPATSANFASFASTSSSIAVAGRGNGHGHGMSQYGAQGAAIAGLSSAQIARFYYPGTSLRTLHPVGIRVLLSTGGAWPEVSSQTPGISVTGYGRLDRTAYVRFRLTASWTGDGLRLGAQRPSGHWTALATNLPSTADFSSPDRYIRLFAPDGSSTRYHGSVGAVRNGSQILTINRVSLDNYTIGVVPREMPASWRPAAVGAQAIAVRTYGRNAIVNNTGSAYDICDTSSCQVYGGMARFSPSGALEWSDDPAAIVGNQNMVLLYGGRAIFAQFSASNGGSVLNGGLPYLVDEADPYDNSSSGDPYLGWNDSVSAASVASYYGLKSVSSIQVTRRNGYGTWGGWVLSATVTGTSYSGSPAHVSTSGSTLASAMGVLTAYVSFGS